MGIEGGKIVEIDQLSRGEGVIKCVVIAEFMKNN